jgi:hypothetical protein
MKTKIILILTIFTATASLSALPLIPFTLGAAFPHYDNTYMLVGSGVHFPLENNLELSLTGAFGIRTEDTESGDVDADLFIPINGGVNFLFPTKSNFTFLAGVGFNAQMEFSDDFSLQMGPYVRGGIRYRVHKNMQLTIGLQQDLVFGPPEWINTTTQVNAGIVCNLD